MLNQLRHRCWLPALAVLLALLSMPLAAWAQAEPRLALVIGNSAYQTDPLRNPVHDAADMARALQGLGFRVTLARDATQRQMVEKINEFGRELKKSGGIGLFYFAGHGVQSKGRNYLVPVNATVNSEDELEFEAVDANRLLAVMDAAENRVNIVVLDACRNNPFARSFRSASRGLAQMDAAKGSYLAFATAPGSVAADGSGNNGVYTEALLKSLREADTDIHKVFTRVTAEVARSTGGRQVPWTASSLTGDFAFTTPAPAVVALAPATLPAPPRQPAPALQYYGGEEHDFGVAATSTPKRSPYHAPTPRAIPGGQVIHTQPLKQLLDSKADVVVVDVLDTRTRATVPGATWLSGAGLAPFYGAEKARLAAALERLSGGHKSRMLVFLCLNPECWLSYNAALYAIEAGYTNVHWFRGGSVAWQGAGFRVASVTATSW